MKNGYWDEALRQRISRRRALSSATSLVAGAAALVVSCGGNGAGGKATLKDTSGLLTQPMDTTKQAAKGGVLGSFQLNEPPHLDPNATGHQTTQFLAIHSYARLFTYKPGSVLDPPAGIPEGEAVNAWELANDGLTLTMKLRPQKLDPRPPTNGRQVTVEDVKWSWERWASLNPGNTDLLAAKSPDSPIESISFPDSNTIVLKMKFPCSALYGLLSSQFVAPWVMPIEADGKFDPRQEMRGSGPWLLTKYEPSLTKEYRRNPNWWRADQRPFLDGIEYPLVSEAATRIAQLKAKRIWGPSTHNTMGYVPGGDVVLTIKREEPGLELRGSSPLIGQGNATQMGISKLDTSPLNQDVRIRHAMSMLFDREAAIDALNNVSGFRKLGLPVETGWHTHIACSWKGYWLDPQKNELGEVSKYYHYNPDEAAKLLRAAGKFGMDLTWNLSNIAVGGGPEPPILQQMLQQGGHFKVKVETRDYNTDYLNNVIFNNGQWEGVAGLPYGTWADFDMAMFVLFSATGRNSMVSKKGLPGINEIMARHRRELDPKRRLAITHEWVKEMAAQMPTVPYPGAATIWTLNWPWLGNAGVESLWGGTGSMMLNYWYDRPKDTRPV